MGTYERKTREIQKSLHRRARMRRAYFKMIGEDPKKRKAEKDKEDLASGKQIDITSVSDSEDEADREYKKDIASAPTPEAPKKLTGRQLARRRRAEKYHKEKERQEELERVKNRREQHKSTMMKRTSKGQPKLGSQVGVLLDKIRKSESGA